MHGGGSFPLESGRVLAMLQLMYFALFLVPLFVLASEKQGSSSIVEEVQIVEAFDCANGKDVRRLEAQTKEAGCILLYTKFGNTSQIGNSRRGVELCREKLKAVREKLERSGYACK
jgi:hypothetical protein